MHLGLVVKAIPRKIRHLKVCGYLPRYIRTLRIRYDGLFVFR